MIPDRLDPYPCRTSRRVDVMRTLGVAAAVGLLSGGVAALVAGAMFEPFEMVGTWGSINGVTIGVVAFLVVTARGRGWLGVGGRWLLVLALAFVCWWALFFALRLSPLSLDGLWVWSITLVAVVALLAAVRRTWRSRSLSGDAV